MTAPLYVSAHELLYMADRIIAGIFLGIPPADEVRPQPFSLVGSIWGYSLAAVLLFLVVCFCWLLLRRKKRQKIKPILSQPYPLYENMSDKMETVKKTDSMMRNDDALFAMPVSNIPVQCEIFQPLATEVSSSEAGSSSQVLSSHDYTKVEAESSSNGTKFKERSSQIPGKNFTDLTLSAQSEFAFEVPINQIHTKKRRHLSSGIENNVTNKPVNGRLKYKIGYDFDNNKLAVLIKEVVDLPARESGRTYDPFVEVTLLPSKKKFHTKAQRHTLNPVFDETIYFKDVTHDNMILSSLILAVWDQRQFKKHEPIGKVIVILRNIDFTYDQNYWSDRMISTPGQKKSLGEICLTLRYSPLQGFLTIVILEAKSLPKLASRGRTGPYVKVYVIKGGVRITKKKTGAKKDTLAPYYNEFFTFNVPYVDVSKVTVVVTVAVHNRFGKYVRIGQVTLSHNATGAELKHWSEAMGNCQKSFTRWHALKEAKGEEH